jgi:hypothetical protein
MEGFPLCIKLSNVTALYYVCTSQSFAGVSQEGYKLQQTGQVVQDFIISSTV